MAKNDTAVKLELADKVEANAEVKVKRTMLTPEQKIAKAEAELAELKAKAQAKVNKAKTESIEKRSALITKRDALNAQIRALTDTIGDGVAELETDAA